MRGGVGATICEGAPTGDASQNLPDGSIPCKRPAIWYRGANPPCRRTTAVRYRGPSSADIATIRVTAPEAPGSIAKDGIPLMITAVAEPASSDARRWRQTTANTVVAARPMGFPAYHIAGIVRAQKDTVQATAIPTGPQGNPARKSRQVTMNSMIPQRNHRSARPIEKWIQP